MFVLVLVAIIRRGRGRLEGQATSMGASSGEEKSPVEVLSGAAKGAFEIAGKGLEAAKPGFESAKKFIATKMEEAQKEGAQR